MKIQLPDELERGLRATIAEGRFASEEEAIVEAVRRLLHALRSEPTSGLPATPRNPECDPVLGTLREAADELDEIVAEAMRRRREEPWRVIPGE